MREIGTVSRIEYPVLGITEKEREKYELGYSNITLILNCQVVLVITSTKDSTYPRG